MICVKCGKEYNGEIYRTSTCDCCSDLHVCYNCKFYSSGSHYDCAETVDDIVVDKEKSNFCEYFSAGKNSINSLKTTSNLDAKLKAEALFGGEKIEETKTGKDAFDALFGGL